MSLVQNLVGREPLGDAEIEFHWCRSAMAVGEWVVYDSTAALILKDRLGVKIAPATADQSGVMGVCVEMVGTSPGTSAAPIQCKIVRSGWCLKAKVASGTAAGPLVTSVAATGLAKAAANSDINLIGDSITAEGTLQDGTVVAGYASVLVKCK